MSTIHRTDHGAEEGRRLDFERSPEWPEVEKAHLRKQPTGVCCKPGRPRAPVQVHHNFPFHYCLALGRPDLELDDRNLITLCEEERDRPADNHHLLVGHLGDFQSCNLDVAQDARTTFHGKTAPQIIKDRCWLAKQARKLTPLDEMSAVEKRALRKAMDGRLPRRR